MQLAKIAKLDSGVIHGLLVAFAGLLGAIAVLFFHVSQQRWDLGADSIVRAFDILFTAGGVAYAAYARINLPTPPVSDKAVVKRDTAVASGALKVQPTTAPITPAPDTDTPIG